MNNSSGSLTCLKSNRNHIDNINSMECDHIFSIGRLPTNQIQLVLVGKKQQIKFLLANMDYLVSDPNMSLIHQCFFYGKWQPSDKTGNRSIKQPSQSINQSIH